MVMNDPLIEKIDAVLPQTQCQQCGFLGCKPYAEAIVSGEAEINQCPPGDVEGIQKIADILGYEPDELSVEEQLTDISSILTTTFLNVFASQIENQMSYSAPRLISANNSPINEYLAQLSFSWDLALKVKITYQVTDFSFNCDMILLIPEAAIINIKDVIDKILEDF